MKGGHGVGRGTILSTMFGQGLTGNLRGQLTFSVTCHTTSFGRTRVNTHFHISMGQFFSFIYGVQGGLGYLTTMGTLSFVYCGLPVGSTQYWIKVLEGQFIGGSFVITRIGIYFNTIIHGGGLTILGKVRHTKIGVGVQIGLLHHGLWTTQFRGSTRQYYNCTLTRPARGTTNGRCML